MACLRQHLPPFDAVYKCVTLWTSVKHLYLIKKNKTKHLPVLTSACAWEWLYNWKGKEELLLWPSAGTPPGPFLSCYHVRHNHDGQALAPSAWSTEPSSTHLWIWQACRLPSMSCSCYLKQCDGLKTSAGTDLAGVRKTDILKVASWGLHLETAVVSST